MDKTLRILGSGEYNLHVGGISIICGQRQNCGSFEICPPILCLFPSKADPIPVCLKVKCL